jgi:hypothetical protein
MGTTPIYGFPYPGVNDSPNGPAQIQALAEAVEADLALTDAAATALSARVTGLTAAVEGVMSGPALGMLNAAAVDIPGATTSVTTTGANKVIVVVATCDAESNGTTDIGVVTCVFNGVTQAGEIHWGPSGRASYSKVWRIPVVAAGTYPVKLQGRKTGGTNTFTLYPTHTNIVATVLNN